MKNYRVKKHMLGVGKPPTYMLKRKVTTTMLVDETYPGSTMQAIIDSWEECIPQTVKNASHAMSTITAMNNADAWMLELWVEAN